MPGGGPIPGGMPALIIPGRGTIPIGAMPPCIGGGLIPIGGLMPGGGPIMPGMPILGPPIPIGGGIMAP